MFTLALLLAILALPVLFVLGIFLRVRPFDTRIGITSFAEVMRLRGNTAAVSNAAAGGSSADFEHEQSPIPAGV